MKDEVVNLHIKIGDLVYITQCPNPVMVYEIHDRVIFYIDDEGLIQIGTIGKYKPKFKKVEE